MKGKIIRWFGCACLIIFVPVQSFLIRMSATPDKAQFHAFMEKFNKPYSPESGEANKRFHHFLKNVRYIHESNAHQKKYRLGVNQFADEDFSTLHTQMFRYHFPIQRKPKKSIHALSSRPVHEHLPDSWDWHQLGKVSRVKNQGKCGSCWAFSTTGLLESRLRIRHNNTVELSEQQLLDCSFSNHACQGGLMHRAIDDINMMGGIQTADSYPYTGEKNKCHLNYHQHVPEIGFLDYQFTEPYDIEDMKQKLVQYGPLCSAVEVDSMDFLFYQEGIYDKDKSSHRLNHAVLLTGFQHSQDKKKDPYWIIKNSWGSEWGEQGFMRIALREGDGEGVCGVHLYGLYLQ